MKTNTTSVRRSYPQKPYRLNKQQDLNVDNALVALKEFYHMAKREIKLSDKANVQLNVSPMASHVKFTCDGFNLELNFTEGGNEV